MALGTTTGKGQAEYLHERTPEQEQYLENLKLKQKLEQERYLEQSNLINQQYQGVDIGIYQILKLQEEIAKKNFEAARFNFQAQLLKTLEYAPDVYHQIMEESKQKEEEGKRREEQERNTTEDLRQRLDERLNRMDEKIAEHNRQEPIDITDQQEPQAGSSQQQGQQNQAQAAI